MDRRRNPETLLKQAQEEERQKRRGKLKIYLGAAPGVGKTHNMLIDANAKRAQGLDVVIGVVETHRRAEIENLVKNCDTLPLQTVTYHGKNLKEFDLDAALKRNPALILIDEMAHTNAPGLRHAKRWQDIKEILDRGIDVYTTLNVQHVESLSDLAGQIIHSRITETVPDSMIEMADTIELVDLPPEDLLRRLQEGKVYFPAQAELAAEHFFLKGNLIALRELALRMTAERVSAQVLLYRQGKGIRHVWPTRDKLLVCVGSKSSDSKLIRAARRLATRLQAEWIAVYVDTARFQLSEKESNQAVYNLRLAEQLGAQTHMLTGYDAVKTIIDFAHEQNITQILVGKTIRPRWRELICRNFADELVRQSGEIDVYTVTKETAGLKTKEPANTTTTEWAWREYALALGVVTLATLINILLSPYFHLGNLFMMYMLGAIIIAMRGKIGPAIFSSIISVLAFAYVLNPPSYAVMSDLEYFLTLAVLLLLAVVISNLTVTLRRQTLMARQGEQRMAVLHTLSRELASTRGIDKLLSTAVRYLGEQFNSEVIALIPVNEKLTERIGFKTMSTLGEKEMAVAKWVFDLGQTAGKGTDTLPFSDAIYVPLLAMKGTIGVMRVHPLNPGALFTPEQMILLEACVNQIAVALEVDRLQEETKRTELKSETDRARSALLQAVSHDLHTPLAVVMGASRTLMELGGKLDSLKIKQYGKDIYVEMEHLSRLLDNILQITYLEAESVKLNKDPQSLSELIEIALKISAPRLGKKPMRIDIPEHFPLVPFDHALLQAVFINLIDNAIKFTPRETPIEISARLEHDHVVISVKDSGPGIVPDEVDKLFVKFYRGRQITTERGLGLGLAICNSIVIAHGGKMWAENRPEGGAAFYFTLPLR